MLRKKEEGIKMSEISKKIKILESDMDAELAIAFLHQQHAKLKDSMQKPSFAWAFLLGSFALGYLFSRKKTPKQLITKSVAIPFFVVRIFRQVKLFSSFIV
jgi:choline-glycine betaine transporter